MNAHDGTLTRRSMLRTGAAWAVASMYRLRAHVTKAAQQPATYASLRPAKSRVVLIRRPDVVRPDGSIDAGVLRAMLDEATKTLTQTPSASAAWQRLVKPTDVVGIKSNAWRSLPTPAALEEAIREAVGAAGVSAGQHHRGRPRRARQPGVQRAPRRSSTRGRCARTRWSGLGTCLKNYIMFVPRPADYHDDACAPLGAIWQQPDVKGKTRLNVLVMLTPQFHSVGPHSFSQEFTWPYGGLIVGTDVVAVDAVGARIIQAKRRAHFGEDRPLSRAAPHPGRRHALRPLATRPAKIDLVRLGEAEEPDMNAVRPTPIGIGRRELLTRWGPAALAARRWRPGALLSGREGRHRPPDDRALARPATGVSRGTAGPLVVATGPSPADNVRRALAGLGRIERFVKRGEKVVVKPNCAWDRTPEQAANTDPALVGELVRLCLAAGASSVVVADSTCHDPDRSFQRSGRRRRGAGGRSARCAPGSGAWSARFGGTTLGPWDVLKAIAEADRVINVPLVKHHGLARATLGMKNWIGAVRVRAR